MAIHTFVRLFIVLFSLASALQSAALTGRKPDDDKHQKPEIAVAVEDDADPFAAAKAVAQRIAGHNNAKDETTVRRSGPYTQTLKNLGDVQYTGVIKVGGQNLNAVIDTGSFELVVLSTNCSVCGQKKHLYDNAKSSKYKGSSFENEEAYGSGTTYSREAHDEMAIGNLPAISKQFFWEVHDANMPLLMEDSFAAIFGTGPPLSALKFALDDQKQIHEELDKYIKENNGAAPNMRETAKHYDDVVAHAKEATSVAKNILLNNMSVCFGSKSGSAGYYIWNDTAAQDFHHKFTTIDVVGDVYWSATLTDVKVGSTHVPAGASQDMKNAASAMDLGCEQDCSAIIDTGTSLIVMPSAIQEKVTRFIDNWQEAGGTCDDLSALPDLEFKLNGKIFTLPAESYIGRLTGSLSQELKVLMPHLVKTRTKKNWGNCQPLIMSMDSSSQFGPLWILGMPFFRKYYTSFQFIQQPEWFPKASTMSFSVADADCKPDTSVDAENAARQNGKAIYRPSTGKRKAELEVDASKIRIPRLGRAPSLQRSSKVLSGLPTHVRV